MSKEHAYAYEAGYQDGLRAAASENATLRRRVSEFEERIASLGKLVNDSLAVILGWAWKLNEIGGHDKYDPDTLPMETFSKLLSRAKELGVPDA